MSLTETDRVYDELLVTLVRSGEPRAAARLAARWQPRLLRTARRILRDEEMAVEAVQEAWMAICRGWGGLREPSRFPAWAFRILHHKCADRLRVVTTHRARHQEVEEAQLPVRRPAVEDRLAVDQAFAALSPDHRIAATLYFAEGLTLAEIAHATGVPVGTAKSRIFHARRQLKSLLEGEDR